MGIRLTAVLMLGVTSMSIVLFSQSAAAAAAPGSAVTPPSRDAIETIEVTAQRRAEESQKVPIALTAIDGTDLDSQGIIGFEQLSTRVPSLRFGAGVTGGENVITMRGLGSQNTTNGGDSPVAYSVDGVPLQRSTTVDPEFFDINRIEVLRGPQGTLYGRNSVGGSINVITNSPTDTVGGGADVLIGDFSQRTFRGWANAPLADGENLKVYGRVTGVSAEHNPYANNRSTVLGADTDNLDAQDYQMLRGQLYFEFSPDLNLLLMGSTSQDDAPAAANVAWWQVPTRYTTGTDPVSTAPNSVCDFSTEAKWEPRTFCQDYPIRSHNDVELYAATLNYDFGWAGLTSVTGYATSNVSQTSDGDGANIPMALGSQWYMRQEQASQELRLASNADSAMQWLVGLFYFWADNYENFAYSDTGLNDTFPIPGGFDQFNFLSNGNQRTESYAAFGQVDYDLGQTSMDIPLTITLGLRYTDDTKDGYNWLDYQLPVFCGGSCGITQGPFEQDWSEWTGKAGVSYQLSDESMLWVSASRGYLSGGNIIGLGSIYDPETMWSYEIGAKSRFMDDRLQINISAYYEEIEDLQVFIQSAVSSGLDNVDDTTDVSGVEIELDLIPIDNLRINVAATFTDAQYGTYISKDARFGGPGPGCSPNPPLFLCNYKGNDLNQTPPYSVYAGIEYSFETSIGSITPRLDTFFSGEVQFLPDNYFTSTQDEYSLTNFTVTWQSAGENEGRYRVEAFVRNIEDEDVISNDGLQSITLGQQALQPDNFVYYPPRTVGARFGITF
ncbi:MAG TPA: TonB-dependent receptor [Pseudomonadales bacterium]